MATVKTQKRLKRGGTMKTTELTDKQVKALLTRAKVLGFREYKGPAGPTDKQSDANNEALARLLKHKRVANVSLVPLASVEYGIEDDGTMAVRVGHRYLAFDRWGYVGGLTNGRGEWLDQITLECAYMFLSGRLTVKQILSR